MAVERIKFRLKAFSEIRTCPAVEADIVDRADRIAAAAGPGYDAEHRTSPRSRARSAVIAVDGKARADNAKNNTLIRSLDAGR